MSEFYRGKNRDFIFPHGIVPPRWFPEYDMVMVRLYPSSIQGVARATEVAMRVTALAKILDPWPIGISLFELTGAQDIISSTTSVSFTAGAPHIQFDMRDAKLSPGGYIALISPCAKDGVECEGKAVKKIELCRGLLSGALGYSAAHELVWEFRTKQQPDQIGFVSNPVERHNGAEFHVFLNTSPLETLIERMCLDPASGMAGRLQTSARFLAAADELRDPQARFMNAWIALEVLVGKSPAPLAALRRVWGSREPDVPDLIRRTRNKLVHEGRTRVIAPCEEVLMRAAIFQALADAYEVEGLVSLPDWVTWNTADTQQTPEHSRPQSA
jgi:hypothetical protein